MAGKKGPPEPELLADLLKALPEGELRKATGRKRKAPSKGPKTLPALGTTPESVQKFTATLARFLESGHISTSVSKELTNVSNTHLRSINVRMRREDLERYEELVQIVRKERQEGLAYEEACRKHKVEPIAGKWLPIELPDGSKAMKHVAD